MPLVCLSKKAGFSLKLIRARHASSDEVCVQFVVLEVDPFNGLILKLTTASGLFQVAFLQLPIVSLFLKEKKKQKQKQLASFYI